MGLHYDEKYFEDPYKFNPDRFADGSNDYSSVYMPFGNGPRFCIGKFIFCGNFSHLSHVDVISLISNFEADLSYMNEKILKELEICNTRFETMNLREDFDQKFRAIFKSTLLMCLKTIVFNLY